MVNISIIIIISPQGLKVLEKKLLYLKTCRILDTEFYLIEN